MRLAFDFVDKDSVLEDGRKARKKEPGTPNGCMAEQPAYLKQGCFMRQKYSLSPYIVGILCYSSFLFSLSIYQHTWDIIFHKEKGSVVK